MTPDTFHCAQCGGEFLRDRPEEEAVAECRENFGCEPDERFAVVCDECYRGMAVEHELIGGTR